MHACPGEPLMIKFRISQNHILFHYFCKGTQFFHYFSRELNFLKRGFEKLWVRFDLLVKMQILQFETAKNLTFNQNIQSNPYKLRRLNMQGFPHGLPKSAIFMHKKRTLPPRLGFKVSTAINVGFLTYYSGRVGARTWGPPVCISTNQAIQKQANLTKA